jgi:glycosyltransferase involved in cell wall biosynthesis
VLRFVSAVQEQTAPTAAQTLASAYQLPERYIFLPNQFWRHKNHDVVVEALGIAKAQALHITVVCTGGTADRRHPGHFDALLARAAQLGVTDAFRVLGVVPYADVKALARQCAAVLNPSFFEGWSTTVEEAKALGKAVILSDIPVHREQSPARATYFEPRDAAALADAMDAAIASFNRADERSSADAAAALNGTAFTDFGRRFERIALDACEVRTA